MKTLLLIIIFTLSSCTTSSLSTNQIIKHRIEKDRN
jgi:hypothetical protein